MPGVRPRLPLALRVLSPSHGEGAAGPKAPLHWSAVEHRIGCRPRLKSGHAQPGERPHGPLRWARHARVGDIGALHGAQIREQLRRHHVRAGGEAGDHPTRVLLPPRRGQDFRDARVGEHAQAVRHDARRPCQPEADSSRPQDDGRLRARAADAGHHHIGVHLGPDGRRDQRRSAWVARSATRLAASVSDSPQPSKRASSKRASTVRAADRCFASLGHGLRQYGVCAGATAAG